MLTSALLSTLFLATPAQAIELNGTPTLKIQLKDCNDVQYGEKCKDGTSKRIGMGTGKERVQDLIIGPHVTIEADERTVTVEIDREVIVFEVDSPAVGYRVLDIDGDGLNDLTLELDDGSVWVSYQTVDDGGDGTRR